MRRSGLDKKIHEGTRGAFWFACRQLAADCPRSGYIYLPDTHNANGECVQGNLNASIIFEFTEAKLRRNKCFVGNAFWMELRSEWTDRELDHVCFASMKELWQQVYFRRIYSLRGASTPEISLSFSSGTPK